jgi:hypothetical protein
MRRASDIVEEDDSAGEGFAAARRGNARILPPVYVISA